MKFKYITIFLFLFCKEGSSYTNSIYSQLDVVNKAFENYYSDCKEYPSRINGFIDLVSSSKPCWHGPYIDDYLLYDLISKKTFKYSKYQFNQSDRISIQSAGYDGMFGTEDDLRSNDNRSIRRYKKLLYKNKIRLRYTLITLAIVFFILLFCYNCSRSNGK